LYFAEERGTTAELESACHDLPSVRRGAAACLTMSDPLNDGVCAGLGQATNPLGRSVNFTSYLF
jgi:hypothetical protein